MTTTPHSPWARVAGLGVALSFVVALVVLAFSWPGVTAEPRDLPIAVTGPAEAVAGVEAALASQAEGAFLLEEVADRDAAVAAIEAREAYGALVLGTAPEVLTASAASPIVAQQLAALAGGLEERLQQAIAAQVPAGAPVPDITVTVTDVVPLVDADPRGTGLIAAAFPLVLGGLIGGAGLTIALVGVVRRLVGLAVYAVVAGTLVTLVLQTWLGVLPGPFVLDAAVFAAALVAIGAPIIGSAAVFGRPGLAIGPVLFLLIANPISSASTPVEFLPAPWGAVGQWFPPGAGATLLRDSAYFPAANTLQPWLVLAGWTALGVVLALVGRSRATGGASEHAIEEAEATA